MTARESTGKRADGSTISRAVLLHSRILGLARLPKDRDRRTPSLFKLVEALNDTALLSTLREESSVWNIAPVSGYEPELIAMIPKAERLEEAGRRLQFDGQVAELADRWKKFEASPALKGSVLCATGSLLTMSCSIRTDSIVSWTSEVGLKINDVSGAIIELQTCVDLASLIYWAASF